MNKGIIKTFVLVLFIGCALAGSAYVIKAQLGIAQDVTGDSAVSDSSAVSYSDDEEISREIDNIAFGVGEWLKFDLGYGFINAGTATMEVKDVVDFNGRPAYQIISTAESNKFFSSFYPVQDRVESILDAIGLFSWRFEKNLREGKYRADRTYTFDQVNHTVVYKSDTIVVAPYVQDALSLLYYARTQPMEVGKSFYIDNFTDGKNYPLEVRILEKERIKVKAGEFECMVVEPLLQSAGIFKHEGKLTVWLTNDRLRLPVMMKTKVVVGSITAELTDYRLGRLEEF
jgi:hypothetical protein